MAKQKGQRGGGAGSIVMIVFGAIFIMGGIGTTAEGALVSAASTALGGGAGAGVGLEAIGIGVLLVGLLLLIAGIVLYRRR